MLLPKCADLESVDPSSPAAKKPRKPKPIPFGAGGNEVCLNFDTPGAELMKKLEKRRTFDYWRL